VQLFQSVAGGAAAPLRSQPVAVGLDQLDRVLEGLGDLVVLGGMVPDEVRPHVVDHVLQFCGLVLPDLEGLGDRPARAVPALRDLLPNGLFLPHGCTPPFRWSSDQRNLAMFPPPPLLPARSVPSLLFSSACSERSAVLS